MVHIKGCALIYANYLRNLQNNQLQYILLFTYSTNLFTSSAGTGNTTPFSGLSFERKDTITALYHIRYAIPKVAASVCNRIFPHKLSFGILVSVGDPYREGCNLAASSKKNPTYNAGFIDGGILRPPRAVFEDFANGPFFGLIWSEVL